MTDIAPVFPAFPAISGKKVTAAFDGGKITSNAGVLLLAQAEKRLGIAPRLAALFPDERDPTRVQHLLPDILLARYLAIAAGYEDASMQLMRCRQQLLAFLLRHGRTYVTGKTHWTLRHRHWLATQQFDEPAQTVVFQDYVEAVWTATDRKTALAERIEELVPEWKLGRLVSALRCVRGLELVSAATILAAIGDISRFEKPQHLMSYLGLVPSEHSSGGRIRRGSITKTTRIMDKPTAYPLF